MSLRERKQQRAREQIVEAAYALFVERGYAQVTVTDIAERAEVGRTTFFRYFGDKQEVVFADEQDLLTAFGSAGHAEAPQSLRQAMARLRDLAEQLAPIMIGDRGRYVIREQLITDNPDLRDRADRKLQQIAGLLEQQMLDVGTDPALAVLAAQVAIACFRGAQRLAGTDPDALMPTLRRLADLVVT